MDEDTIVDDIIKVLDDTDNHDYQGNFTRYECGQHSILLTKEQLNYIKTSLTKQPENTIKTYIIIDTKTGEQFQNGGKAFWRKQSYAKSALLYKVPQYPSDREFFEHFEGYLTDSYKTILSENKQYPPSLLFKDQTRYKCYECDVILTKEC